jgi:hypothetical protein
VRIIGPAISFKQAEHVKFRRTVVWKGEERGYMIDVVTERAFPAFVAMVETELERTALGVTRHIRVIRDTHRRRLAEAQTQTKSTEKTSAGPQSEPRFDALASGIVNPPTV